MPLPEHLQRLLAECDVETYRGSGPGGQHRNKTESAVRLRHRPTGLTRVGTEERSQLRNKRAALERLHQALEAARRRKKKRVATRPTGSSKLARMDSKRRRAVVKRLRSSKDDD